MGQQGSRKKMNGIWRFRQFAMFFCRLFFLSIQAIHSNIMLDTPFLFMLKDTKQRDFNILYLHNFSLFFGYGG